ncbi:MAG: OmpH family outer membrane protein [Bacteroidales bacterium]|nr:OmpH family outer membrane protein [Bacteroidales bacterium]MDE7338452.1 OmpH family outer membrane protein [Bacteroidales bacterium]
MKKYILIAVVGLMGLASAAFTNAQAQKYAYVNTEYILSNIPEFAQAQEQIDKLSIEWQKELEEKFAEIDALYKKFQNDAPLLTQDMKNRRENEIIAKEKAAKDLQKKRFGVDGDLYKQRAEMIQPIQDKVYTAIEKKAKQKQFVFVFDRSDNSGILYADPKNDISNEVLKDMGYEPGKEQPQAQPQAQPQR